MYVCIRQSGSHPDMNNVHCPENLSFDTLEYMRQHVFVFGGFGRTDAIENERDMGVCMLARRWNCQTTRRNHISSAAHKQTCSTLIQVCTRCTTTAAELYQVIPKHFPNALGNQHSQTDHNEIGTQGPHQTPRLLEGEQICGPIYSICNLLVYTTAVVLHLLLDTRKCVCL